MSQCRSGEVCLSDCRMKQRPEIHQTLYLSLYQAIYLPTHLPLVALLPRHLERSSEVKKKIGPRYYGHKRAINVDIFKRLKAKLGLTQEKLAEKAGVTLKVAQRAEQGRYIAKENAAAIARVLKVAVDQLFTDALNLPDQPFFIQETVRPPLPSQELGTTLGPFPLRRCRRHLWALFLQRPKLSLPQMPCKHLIMPITSCGHIHFPA